MTPGTVVIMARLVCALLVLFGVLGCGGSPERAASLPPLPSVATSPSGSTGGSPAPATPSSSTPPVLKPPEADQATREGAAAFARFWFDVLNTALATVDADTLSQISEPGCETCQNYIGSLDRSASAGEHYKGGTFIVKDVVTAPEVGLGASVLVNYDVTEALVYDRSGSLIETIPAATGTTSFDTRRVSNTWHAAQLIFTP